VIIPGCLHPNLDRGDTVFVMRRSARDLDDVEQVEFGELM
jgi:hypothetical protein